MDVGVGHGVDEINPPLLVGLRTRIDMCRSGLGRNPNGGVFNILNVTEYMSMAIHLGRKNKGNE